MSYRHLLLSAFLALPFAAYAEEPALAQSDNTLLRGAVVFLGVVMIWIVLYQAVYPFFLRYYRDEYCKTVFWNLFLLFTLTWIFVSFYVVLDLGFSWVWMPWAGVFLGVWWLISGAVLLLRRVPA
jgi:uncharacterized membrane protein